MKTKNRTAPTPDEVAQQVIDDAIAQLAGVHDIELSPRAQLLAKLRNGPRTNAPPIEFMYVHPNGNVFVATFLPGTTLARCVILLRNYSAADYFPVVYATGNKACAEFLRGISDEMIVEYRKS